MKHPHTTRRLRIETLEARRVLSTISGTLWNDVDGDGTRHVLEPGLPGRTVYLDANDNGRLDGGESTATTDATGSYAFSGLPAGNYTVQQVLRPGWRQTSPVETRAEWVDVLAPTDGVSTWVRQRVAFGPDGNLYFNGPGGVSRFDVSTGDFIDSFVPPISDLGGIVFGPDENLYLLSRDVLPRSFHSDCDQVCVLRFDGRTGRFIDVFAQFDPATRVDMLVFGPDGDLFLAGRQSGVLRIDGASGAFLGEFVPKGDWSSLAGVTFGPGGDLLATTHYNLQNVAKIFRFDGLTGGSLGTFIATGTNNPPFSGTSFGPDGHLYVIEREAGATKVLRYHGATGAFIDVYALALSDAIEINFDAGGNMYLTGEGILRFQGSLGNNPGATIDVFREPSPLQLSLDFTFGSDGTVYINSWGTDSIERYDPASGQYLGSFVARGAGGLDSPRGIAFGPDGNLYVASHLTDQILRYDGDTGDFLDVFVTADRGGLRRPLGIHFGPAGQLFVSHYFSDEILRYDGATGRFIDAFVPTGSGGLTRPWASTFGPDGALYVSSQSVSFVREGVTFHDVLRYDGETGEFIDVFAVTPNGRSEGLEFGPDGYLYVGQRTTGSVLRFDGESGALIDEFIPGGLGSSSAGRFVHFGRDGLLYASFQFSGLHRFELIKNGRDVSLGNQQTRAGIDFGSQHTGVGPVEDLTGNGFVDFEDLTVLLANWNKDVTAADGNLVEPLTSVVNFEDLTV